MRGLNFILAIATAIILLVSCDGGSFLSASSSTNEVLVIMDDKEWEGVSGKALFDVLNSPCKGLPQTEANFKILQISQDNFSSTFKMARNIIIPEISNIYTKPKITSESDKYAVGQVIMTIKAPDSTSFASFVTENKDFIVNYIIRKELERTSKWLIQSTGTPQSKIEEIFGINIHYPKGISNTYIKDNFFWATNDAPESRLDIAIFQFPYTSEAVFEKDSLIAIRNRFLGKHITGAAKSQMITAVVPMEPEYERFEINGIFRAQLRGLWEMTNDMMGGPFVMQAFVNEKTNMVIVVDVFVYAPEKNKRNLMRNMEASLYTIQIPEKK